MPATTKVKTSLRRKIQKLQRKRKACKICMIRNGSTYKNCRCKARENHWYENIEDFNDMHNNIDLQNCTSTYAAILVVDRVKLEHNPYRFRDVNKWFKKKLYPQYDGAPNNLDIDMYPDGVDDSDEDIGYFSVESDISDIED